QDAQIWLQRQREISPVFSSLLPTHGRSTEYEEASLSRYLAREALSAPGYAAFVEELAKSLPPMDSNCRLSINMPAKQEGGDIYKALGSVLLRENGRGGKEPAQTSKDGRPLDPSTYEINIGINHGTDGDDTNTLEAVEAFKEDCPFPLNINITDVTLPEKYANVGMARRLLKDATFLPELS